MYEEPQARSSLDRRFALALAVAAASGFVLLSMVFVPWDWVPGGTLRALAPIELFSAAEIAEAEDYAGTRRSLGWTTAFASLLLGSLLGFTSLGARLSRRATRKLRWWTAIPVIVAVVLLLGRLVVLPFALAIRDHNLRFGLTRQSLHGWAGDYARGWIVESVIAVVLILGLVALARWRPRWWFAWGSGGAAAAVVMGSFVYPVVVSPMFNSFEPMDEGRLKASVLTIASAQGISVHEVLVADASRRTTTVNAYVAGLGGTRRIVVYDNALNGLTERQFVTIIAHELAHVRHRDVALGTALGAVGAAGGIAVLSLILDSAWVRRRADIRGPSDPAAVPLILALTALVIFLSSPIENSISRSIEARADLTAIATTGDAEAFISTQRELARRALSDPTPPTWSQWWSGSHPTVLERAGLPSSIEKARG